MKRLQNFNLSGKRENRLNFKSKKLQLIRKKRKQIKTQKQEIQKQFSSKKLFSNNFFELNFVKSKGLQKN